MSHFSRREENIRKICTITETIKRAKISVTIILTSAAPTTILRREIEMKEIYAIKANVDIRENK